KADAQFRKDYNNANLSFAKHEINLVPDKTTLDAYSKHKLRFDDGISRDDPDYAQKKLVYGKMVDVMVTGFNPANVGAKKGRGTKTFISMDYFLNNPEAPGMFSSLGMTNMIVHEFFHIFDHEYGTINEKLGKEEMFGGVMTDLEEIDAVKYQQKVIKSLIDYTGLPFEIRSTYHKKN
ncbi:MAG: hypothetical protein RIB86_22710, partial [Imperialibacter sp.]